MDEHVYALKGLHCGSCLEKVHRRLTSHPQVARAEVTRDPDRARVAAMDALTLEALNAWLAGVGEYHLSRDLSADAEPAATPAEPPPARTGASRAATAPAAARAAREAVAPAAVPPTSFLATYKPLLLVVGYILLTTAGLLMTMGSWDPALAMRLFMAGFFIAFSFFKLLDLAGFASAFRGYDVVARAVPGYGKVYPFLELALGLAYLANLAPLATNAVTAVIMAVGLIGVVRAVMSKQTIRCACLGTGFNLPMSTVTIIENSVMLAMALAALAAGVV
jgi:copper chaperone CopZ